MTKKELIDICKNTVGEDFYKIVLSEITLESLVEELRRREGVELHYVDSGMECQIESNEFDGTIEGPKILLEIEDWELSK